MVELAELKNVIDDYKKSNSKMEVYDEVIKSLNSEIKSILLLLKVEV